MFTLIIIYYCNLVEMSLLLLLVMYFVEIAAVIGSCLRTGGICYVLQQLSALTYY